MDKNKELINEQGQYDLKKCLVRFMTITECASKLGISQSSLTQSLQKNISFHRVVEIADVCGVSIGEFLGEKNVASTSLKCPRCGESIKVRLL